MGNLIYPPKNQPPKKSSVFRLIFSLSAKKIFGLPQNEWAALAAAHEKIGVSPDYLIVVQLYEAARTYFTKNC
ncbi:MAG: hypothetical protein WC926_02930 [Candidatus Paceibacterota bacterium]|jgi:hypothetical protein